VRAAGGSLLISRKRADLDSLLNEGEDRDLLLSKPDQCKIFVKLASY
jgi:hypothetical protein